MNAPRGNAGAQLATVKPQESGTAQWRSMYEQAQALVKSGFLPPSIKTPEQAIAVMLTGEELGIPKMLALRSIHVIQGRPTLSADLMASLVQREIDRHKDGLLMVLHPEEGACTVRFRRWGWKDEQAFTYTLDDAKTAGLLGKDTWKGHPKAMLRARATAAVCRMAFPDVIAGLYVPEEISEEEAEAWQATSAQEHVEATVVEPVNIERVDQDTGEISTPPLTLDDDIKRLRMDLGWSAQDVIEDARRYDPNINLRTREGKQAIVDLLQSYVEAVYESEQESEQGSFVDAESHVAGEPGLDRHSA